MPSIHKNTSDKHVQAAREAQKLAFELTAGLLAVQTIEGLRTLRAGCGVTYATKDEALVSTAGQVARKAYERFLTVVERAESLGVQSGRRDPQGVLASDMSDSDVWAEIGVLLAHYEPKQFGIA